MSKLYRHYSDVPTETWRWPNFTPREIACRGSGELLVDEAALDKLQALRDRLGAPLHLNSAYRSEAHNRAVGGSPKSQHRLGRGFDISLRTVTRQELTKAARLVGFTGIGQYDSFIHVDTGPARTWDLRTR